MTQTMDHFDKDFIEEMKTLLLEEKEKLEKELHKIAKPAARFSDDGDFEATYEDLGSELDDDVHEIENYEVNKTLEETLEKNLRDVLSALKRIEEGTYGICKYTGKPISKDRLRVRPTSSASVEAKKVLTDEA